MISAQDMMLVHAFLQREALDFAPHLPLENPSMVAYVNRTQGQIEEIFNKNKTEKVNWINVISLTNIGIDQRVLSLTPLNENWSYEGGVLRLNLPPSFHNGGVGFNFLREQRR